MNFKPLLGAFFISFLLVSCGSNDAEKFIGTWTGNVSCAGDPSPVVFEISLGADDDSILINIVDGDESQIIKATVSGDDLTMETTTIPDGLDYTEVDGSGSINSEGNLILTLDLRFYEDGQLSESGTCIGTLSM